MPPHTVTRSTSETAKPLSPQSLAILQAYQEDEKFRLGTAWSGTYRQEIMPAFSPKSHCANRCTHDALDCLLLDVQPAAPTLTPHRSSTDDNDLQSNIPPDPTDLANDAMYRMMLVNLAHKNKGKEKRVEPTTQLEQGITDKAPQKRYLDAFNSAGLESPQADNAGPSKRRNSRREVKEDLVGSPAREVIEITEDRPGPEAPGIPDISQTNPDIPQTNPVPLWKRLGFKDHRSAEYIRLRHQAEDALSSHPYPISPYDPWEDLNDKPAKRRSQISKVTALFKQVNIPHKDENELMELVVEYIINIIYNARNRAAQMPKKPAKKRIGRPPIHGRYSGLYKPTKNRKTWDEREKTQEPHPNEGGHFPDNALTVRSGRARNAAVGSVPDIDGAPQDDEEDGFHVFEIIDLRSLSPPEQRPCGRLARSRASDHPEETGGSTDTSSAAYQARLNITIWNTTIDYLARCAISILVPADVD